MDWFSGLITAFQALGALEQTAWVGGTLIPIAGVFFGLRRLFAGSRKDQTTLPPPHPVNINLPAPTEKLPTEGQIVGIFHDLDDDAKSRVLETLNKIAGQPPEAEETKEEIAEAVEEARAGDLTDIRALLNARYQKLAAEHGDVASKLAEAARDLAAVEFPDNKGRALTLYRQATELEPDHFWSWINLGVTERACESLDATITSFDRALAVATRKDDNREIAIAESEKADALMASGSLVRAEKGYIAANEAMARRADAAPEDFQRQRDLSVSHNNIGDVRVVQGDLPQALEAYQAALAIAEKLAAADPGNAGWQRDLSVSHNNIGEVRVVQGDLPQALEAYQAALAIAEKLAAADPGNAGWQPDLSVSHIKIGEVRVAQGDLPQALEAFQAGLAIREKLAAADPGNAQWQRDLSVSHDRIGDVRVAQGDLPQALEAYQAALAIAEKLAAADPGNAGWQRDLSVSHNKIGEVRVAQGDLPQALAAFQAGLAIREKLATADPGNAQWQRDLIASNVKLAETGDRPRKRLARALEIARALSDSGRLAPADQWMIDDLKKARRRIAGRLTSRLASPIAASLHRAGKSVHKRPDDQHSAL